MSMVSARRSAAVESEGGPAPCLACNRSTSHESLAELGGRCFPCYQAFCRETRNFPAAPEAEGPRGWIERLRWRETNGEKLNRVQLAAIKEATRGVA